MTICHVRTPKEGRRGSDPLEQCLVPITNTPEGCPKCQYPKSYSTRAAAAARKRRWRELLSDIEEVEREKTRELLRSLKLEVGRESNRTRSRTRVHAAVRLRVLSVHTGHVMRAVQTEPVQVGKLRRSEQAETDDGVDDCRREPG